MNFIEFFLQINRKNKKFISYLIFLIELDDFFNGIYKKLLYFYLKKTKLLVNITF